MESHKAPTLRQTLIPILKELEAKLPLKHPVLIRVAPIKDAFGWCDFKTTKRDGEHFLITVCSGLSPGLAKDTLLHEYAHLLAWFDSKDNHGAEWGYWFSRVYRAVCDDT